MSRVARPKLCGIYLIRNTVSGLCYVGQSSDINRRWRGHLHMLRRQSERALLGLPLSRRPNRRLLNSWMKHGESAFEFSVLELCDVSDLTEKEIHWLHRLRNDLGCEMANFEGPVDNPMRGAKHSRETIAKMSAWSKAFVRTDTHKRRIGEANRGKEVSPATRQKISASKTGKPAPWNRGDKNPSCRPGAKDMFRGSNNPVHKPGVIDKIRKANSKPVVDLDTGEAWNSASAAAVALGVSQAAVSASAASPSRTCRGRNLRYAEHNKENKNEEIQS